MSQTHEKIENIGAIEKKSALRIEEFVQRREIDGDFQAVMDKKLPDKAVDGGNKPNPEEVVKNQAVQLDPAVSHKELIAQTEQAKQKIEAIKQDLETPNLDIKRNVGRLMNNKLTHIDDSLRIALTKAGAEKEEFAATAPVAGEDQKFSPVGRFIDHLTHSQTQLDNLGTYLEALTSQEKQLSPANLLAIQIKVNHIQQELEFFTNLLNKSLESTKALMNVQI